MDKLWGLVEVDECFVGGKEANKHESRKLRMGRGAVGKTAVVGLRERGGRTIAFPVENTDKECLQGAVLENVEIGSQIMTDEATGYTGLGATFSVTLAAGEQVTILPATLVAVSASVKLFDVTGTGAQTINVAAVLN